MKRALKIVFATGTVVVMAAAGYAAVRGKRAEQNPSGSSTTQRRSPNSCRTTFTSSNPAPWSARCR